VEKEALNKSTMNHVVVKNELIARRATQVVLAHGLVTGVASRLRGVRHWPLLPHLRYAIPGRSGMLLSQGAPNASVCGKRSFLTQPLWDRALQAFFGVSLLVKGVPFALSPSLHHILQSRCRGRIGLVQGFLR
jgi:hypothetical protein